MPRAYCLNIYTVAAGDYVPQPEREPEPELPLDELISKMELEFETYDMSISEREGSWNHAGYLGKNYSTLAKKGREISIDDEKFVSSKWIHLQSNNGGLAVPTQDFAKDLDKMNIVFKAHYIY